jgi:hypothetical protein
VDILDSVEGMTDNLHVLPVHESAEPNPVMIRQSERSERSERENERGADKPCLSVY